jgi:hypothetical protein
MLDPKLLPLTKSHFFDDHFTLATPAIEERSGKRPRTQEVTCSPGQDSKRISREATSSTNHVSINCIPRAEALAEAVAYEPSARVLAKLGEHTNRLTAEIGAKIERLLDLQEAATPLDAKEEKLKVHEVVEGDNRVSILVRLVYGPGKPEISKIKKTKKLAQVG